MLKRAIATYKKKKHKKKVEKLEKCQILKQVVAELLTSQRPVLSKCYLAKI